MLQGLQFVAQYWRNETEVVDVVVVVDMDCWS